MFSVGNSSKLHDDDGGLVSKLHSGDQWIDGEDERWRLPCKRWYFICRRLTCFGNVHHCWLFEKWEQNEHPSKAAHFFIAIQEASMKDGGDTYKVRYDRIDGNGRWRRYIVWLKFKVCLPWPCHRHGPMGITHLLLHFHSLVAFGYLVEELLVDSHTLSKQRWGPPIFTNSNCWHNAWWAWLRPAVKNYKIPLTYELVLPRRMKWKWLRDPAP